MLGLFRVFVVGSVRYTSSYKKNYLPSLISTALSLHVQIFLRYFFTHSSLSFLSFWLSNLSKYRFNSDLFFLVNNKIKLNSFFNLFFKKTNFFLDTSTNSYYVDDSNVELLSLDQSFEYPNIDFIASD